MVMATNEYLLLVAGVLLLLAALASKASTRLGVPALLLFLLLGMLAGSEGIGGIAFDDARLAQLLGTIALSFILFAGGLETPWTAVRPVLWSGLALSTVGVLVTTALVGGFVLTALGYSWGESLLVGAIVSSTDAAAVFSVMRSQRHPLQRRLFRVLQLEAGTNDPMAIFLTIGLTQLVVDPATTIDSLALLFVRQMALGALGGLSLGLGVRWLIDRLRFEAAGLLPVLTIAAVLVIYGATASLGGSGFLAVFIAGLALGNRDVAGKQTVLDFHEGLATLMEILMFLTLGLLVFPSHLPALFGVGLLMTLFLIVLARPISVVLSLALARMSVREKAFISWAGLRGAVPIVLATFPLLAGVRHAEIIFDLVFVTVLASVLVQGTSIPLVARWLHVTERTEARDGGRAAGV
jgi:cell volume regulation protein A